MSFKSFPFVCGLASLAVSAHAASTAAKADFDKEIAPLLKTHCWECHTGDEPEGELHLGFKNGAEAVERARNDREIFEKMAEVLREHVMPPEDFKAQPTDANRARLVAWIENDLLDPAPKAVRKPDHAPAARWLSNVENTGPDTVKKLPTNANTPAVSDRGHTTEPRSMDVAPTAKISQTANGPARAKSPPDLPAPAVAP